MDTAHATEDQGGHAVTVEDLARMTLDELQALYARSSTPSTIAALDGEPPGRMLASPLAGRGPALALARRFAASRPFPWHGKAFRSHDDSRGEGVNRLRLLGDRFRFTTGFGHSVVDGAPCVLLDYDHPGNPRPVRRIRDELRQVSAGLFFGPAFVRTRGRHELLLYFAVDNT